MLIQGIKTKHCVVYLLSNCGSLSSVVLLKARGFKTQDQIYNINKNMP